MNDYLFAIALSSGLLQLESDDVSFEGTIALLRDLDRYFIHGAQHAVQHAFAENGDDEGRVAGVLFHLAALRGKRAIAALHGRDRAEPIIDEVLRVFKKHGLPLDQFVRRDRDAVRARAIDIFTQSVVRELGSAEALNPRERATIVAQIKAHFESALHRIDSSESEITNRILAVERKSRTTRGKNTRSSP